MPSWQKETEMKLQPTSPHEVYVHVRDYKAWSQYPLPADLVRQGTIIAIVRPENECSHALVFYSFTQSYSLVPLREIFIFDWDKKTPTSSGLRTAYLP